MNNRRVAKLFRLGGHLLELHGENPFKIRSYENAADSIKKMSVHVTSLNEEELENIEGVGKNLAKKILQIRDTGSYEELDKIMQLTPPGLVELVGVKGIGAKKLGTLWKTLGILSADDLMKACEEGKVAAVKGFGEKTQDNILEVLTYFFASRGKYLYQEAEEEALPLIEELRKNPSVKQSELSGAIRRKTIEIGKIEILLEKAAGYDEKEVMDAAGVIASDGNYVSSELSIPIEIAYASGENFTEQWILGTGTIEHISNLKLDAIKGAKSEKEAYEKSGFPYIIPEMREGIDEFAIMQNINEGNIITYEDLRGCLHNHSKYSDGANTVEEMALKCKELGLEYFGISDHSQTAVYANGLKPDKVLKQFKEVDKLNEKLAPFRVFKGIESDILGNGSLDYEEDILKQFDYVVASIHSGLKMSEADATKRLITAIENPYTTILGHMTSRLLLMREGYPVNHVKVIDACAANDVIMEINANPRRLDIDWKWINYCVEKGVMLSINPDAHAIGEIEYMRYGVYAARKAGLTKDMVLNTLSALEVEKIFQRKKVHA